jgi:hypothetical protein
MTSRALQLCVRRCCAARQTYLSQLKTVLEFTHEGNFDDLRIAYVRGEQWLVADGTVALLSRNHHHVTHVLVPRHLSPSRQPLCGTHHLPLGLQLLLLLLTTMMLFF